MTCGKLQDKCRGSLVGGAVGDALGYEVEFMTLPAIRKKYGERGIVNYELDRNRVAEFSDDTQMSLFTAEGLLSSMRSEGLDEASAHSSIRRSYEHWYATQTRIPYPMDASWLTHLKTLWSGRAPGMTCMEAMHQIAFGDGSPVENNSKGCGGVMRVAPIGIYTGANPNAFDLESTGFLAGFAADITHKHPLSTYSSMALAMLVAECIRHENIDRERFKLIVIDKVFKILGQRFKGDNNLADLFNLILKTIWYATSKESDTNSIRELGQGWVAEETLAIAIFSAMRYIDDFEKCIVCAVNHDGDSDSTGAVAGNIIGAILGYSAIPQKYLTALELHDVLVSVADDLGGFSSEEQMKERYTNHKPFNVTPSYLL